MIGLGIAISAVVGAVACGHFLLPEQRARQNFESHKADYIHLAKLLRNESAVFINGNGNVDIDGTQSRHVLEYSILMRRIGARDALVREDGSIEFTLWGHGCAICSDSYMGVRYLPKERRIGTSPGWTQTEVKSLGDDELPRENGKVASGLYVISIEPEWYIYRFECQE
jgi:hypothetical protein